MEKVFVIVVLIVCGFLLGRRFLRVLNNQQSCSSGCGSECSTCPGEKDSKIK
jgi:hypothetical protein